jgi:hypothetical protein
MIARIDEARRMRMLEPPTGRCERCLGHDDIAQAEL